MSAAAPHLDPARELRRTVGRERPTRRAAGSRAWSRVRASCRCASAASCWSCWWSSRCWRRGSARSTRRCSTRRAATCCPARAGEITTLDGETLKHTLLDGLRQLRPRHLQPRRSTAPRCRWSSASPPRCSRWRSASCSACVAGYLRWLDGLLMRVMDGVMAIPAILIAIALVAMWQRQPAHRGGGDRDPRDPARDAAGALAGAVDPRGAVCRGGDLARHADLEDHAAPHPAQHAWRRWSCRAPSSARPAS